MRCLCVVVLLGSAAADDFRKHLARLVLCIGGPLPVSYTHLTLPTICSV